MMNNEPKRLGNYYGDHFSTGYAGNFYSVECISPTLNTAGGGGREMQILEIKECSKFDKPHEMVL